MWVSRGEKRLIWVFSFLICGGKNSLVMAIQGLFAGQSLSVLAPNGAHHALESVPQEGDVAAPFEVNGQVAQRHAEAGEHHHRNGDCRSQEGTVLRKTNGDNHGWSTKEKKVNWQALTMTSNHAPTISPMLCPTIVVSRLIAKNILNRNSSNG